MENDEYWSSSDIKAQGIFNDDFNENTDAITFMGTSRTQVAQLSRNFKSNVASFKKNDDTIVSDGIKAEGRSQSARFRADFLPVSPESSSSNDRITSSKQKSSSTTQQSLDVSSPPDRMIWRIILGQPYSLDSYKSKQQKLALLDFAIETHDGNAITAVVLFIKSTLKRLLFYQILREKPQALNHYLAFLKSENETSKLSDILSMIGRAEDAAVLNYKLASRSTHFKTRIMEMNKCLANHFQTDPLLEFSAELMREHINLLEKQAPIDKSDDLIQKQGSNEIFQRIPKTTSLINSSVITTLYYCCLYHYGISENNLASPYAIKKAFRISDKQFAWSAVSARARLQRWTDIEAVMSTKTMFGASKIKFVFNPELFIEILRINKASREILGKYISCIDNAEVKLQLAKKCECHQLVVHLLVGMRDRAQLEAYKSKLLAHSSDRQNAQDALNSSTVRWKN